MSIESIRFTSCQLELKDYSLVKVTGADRESFFQGQTTNDFSKLSFNEGQLTARLNRTGKLQSFFFIARLNDFLLLLCPKVLAESIIEDFQKFIIMDDVVLEALQTEICLSFNWFLETDPLTEPYFDFNFYGLNTRLSYGGFKPKQLADEVELEKIRILNGWPVWGTDVNNAQFINDSYLNTIAISYKKGCFLGQETAAKIENNRGAAYFPVLLKLSTTTSLNNYLKKDFNILHTEGLKKAGTLLYQVDDYLQVLLFRDFRVVGRELEIIFENEKIKATVVDLPFFKNTKRSEIALELFHQGVEAFQLNDVKNALKCMQRALDFDPLLSDAYESLGVMLGREEKFEEAIEWMDKLQKINPQSVMAHTNKSLFLMRLGKIEEAEAEKSLATVKSFAAFGEVAKEKKQIANEQQKKEEDISRREKMFLQVLEMDPDDTIALFGMADIFYQRKLFSLAIINLEKIILIDAKLSTAFLLLGKAYEAIGLEDKALSIYQTGIDVASKRGDMMPANEMQSRLNQLIMRSSLT